MCARVSVKVGEEEGAVRRGDKVIPRQRMLITTRLANPSAVTARLLLQRKQVSFRGGRAAPGWPVQMANPCVCHCGREQCVGVQKRICEQASAPE